MQIPTWISGVTRVCCLRVLVYLWCRFDLSWRHPVTSVRMVLSHQTCQHWNTAITVKLGTPSVQRQIVVNAKTAHNNHKYHQNKFTVVLPFRVCHSPSIFNKTISVCISIIKRCKWRTYNNYTLKGKWVMVRNENQFGVFYIVVNK